MHCHVSAQIASYARHQDALEAQDEAMYARAREMLEPGGRCHPFSAENFFEALMDDALSEFSEKIDLQDDIQVGKEIRRIVLNYWTKKADEIVENE